MPHLTVINAAPTMLRRGTTLLVILYCTATVSHAYANARADPRIAIRIHGPSSSPQRKPGMIKVRAGVSALNALPAASLLILGKHRHLQALKFDSIAAKFNAELTADQWDRAIKLSNGSAPVPLVYNLAKLIPLPDKVSRGNAPSSALSIFKEVKAFTLAPDTTALTVVIVAEYLDVLASVAAVARSFPLFSLKSEQTLPKNVDIEVVVADDKNLTDADLSFLNELANAIRETARLIDTPANILTTDALVDEAAKVAATLPNVEVKVIRGEDLKAQGFGGIYHVGKAGPTPPAFVVLSYKPAGSNHTYALVGKGIVYDTGGMQIKTKTGMKRDMGGAAGVLEGFATLVKSGFKQTLHACLCIAENNISPAANKPDDIIRMLSNKTVEISNTDAEGRLVLADGVFYAKNTLGANTIIDMATLTGAQAYVSGRLHAAVLANLEEDESRVEIAGRRSGDLVKSMLFAPDLHFSDLKSSVADMKNSNLGRMEGPPSSIAGLFIGSHINFGEGISWIHLDIAAPVESGERATGFGPALFCALLGKETTVPLLQ